MHALHTTDSFILGSTPHGESNRVYSIFTRDFGFLYAHGQGVRRLDNRNRYALATGSVSSVTLVRGREVWRITGAELGMRSHRVSTHRASARERQVLALLSKFAPREEPLPQLFTILQASHEAFASGDTARSATVEMLSVLRVLYLLGYVAPPTNATWPQDLLESTGFEEGTVRHADEHKTAIITLINNALSSANG